jgi:poly-gamma-glutamate synthase PgsB/CapB
LEHGCSYYDATAGPDAVVSCGAVPAAILACLAALLALGAAERIAGHRARRTVPVRVHVNGSRGKSTVTRLIWSALREAGIPTIGKTTGTAARLLLPDGSERALVRRAAPSIREQLALVREARRRGARALVAECMALDPELQWVSERSMVGATLGVITNVRLDHSEVMGRDLDSIAASLANTIPASGTLVCGDDRFSRLFERRARPLGTRVVSVGAARATVHSSHAAGPSWFLDDVAVALAATRELGVDDDVALRGFASAPPDPGAATSGVVETADGPLHWLDATAANDPESLALVASGEPVLERAPGDWLVVYNHRGDRGARLLTFAAHSALLGSAPFVIVTGERPPLTAWRALVDARQQGPTEFVPTRALAARVRRAAPGSRLVFCGNTRGLDPRAVLREVTAGG